MVTKLFQGAPFGSQTARFDVSGVHPKSKTPGTFTQIPYCKKSTSELQRKLAPGAYSLEYIGSFTDSAVFEGASGPGWKRSYETKRTAQTPHLLYREEWAKKREIVRKLGPGKYDNHKLDFVRALADKPISSRGVCSTRERRFRNKRNESGPGPGSYGKGGVPSALLEERMTKSASNVGMLDSGSSESRALPSYGCGLAPGRYEHDSFTTMVLDKVVSKRGPYDLFTGERGKVNKVGHLAVLPASNLGPGEYQINSFLENWNGEHKIKHGQFGKVQQYPDPPTERIYYSTTPQCPRDPSFPAPNTYNVDEVQPSARNLPPFISSAERSDRRATKFFTGNNNPVGAGRYCPDKWNQAQHRYACKHVFNSKQNRFFSKERDVVMQERVKHPSLNLSKPFAMTRENSLKTA